MVVTISFYKQLFQTNNFLLKIAVSLFHPITTKVKRSVAKEIPITKIILSVFPGHLDLLGKLAARMLFLISNTAPSFALPKPTSKLDLI